MEGLPSITRGILLDNVSSYLVYLRLQMMPLSHLAYANVHRQLVGPSPVTNAHFMQSRSKTDKDSTVSLYKLDNRSMISPAEESKRSRTEPFIFTVPNSKGRDWHLAGYLADPSFVSMFGKFNAGTVGDTQPPTEKMQNTTKGRRGARRRANKAAKASRAQQAEEEQEGDSSDSAPVLKRRAPGDSQAPARKRQRR